MLDVTHRAIRAIANIKIGSLTAGNRLQSVPGRNRYAGALGHRFFCVERGNRYSANSARRRLHQEVVLQCEASVESYLPKRALTSHCTHPRIGRLPALVQPEGALALRVALRVQALLAHVHGNVCHRFGQHVVQFLQMHVALIVDHLRFVEDAVHVALERGILVDFTVAELSDGLCADGEIAVR